jgi:hypothetical protein
MLDTPQPKQPLTRMNRAIPRFSLDDTENTSTKQRHYDEFDLPKFGISILEIEKSHILFEERFAFQ